MHNSARRIDFVARFGGEEFAVITPECSPTGTAFAANRLREAIEELMVEWQGKTLQVTISIGGTLASWPTQARTGEQIIAAADKQLYAAKNAGRNCCKIEAAGEPVVANA